MFRPRWVRGYSKKSRRSVLALRLLNNRYLNRVCAGRSDERGSSPIVNDAYSEGPELFQVKLTNPQGSTLGTLAIANVVIDDTVQPDRLNPNLEADFFIRAHYLDFLGREPDQPGLAF